MYLIKALQTLPPGIRYTNLLDLKELEQMIKGQNVIIRSLHMGEVDLSRAMMAFINLNGIEIKWHDGYMGYIFREETDMNLFLLAFPQFERIVFKP